MSRLLRVAPLLFLFACPTPPSARVLVYPYDDGEPRGELDRETCVTGAGLRLPIGPTESIAFDIAADQSVALLSTCDLDGSAVLGCGKLLPEVWLEIDGTREAGSAQIPVGFEGTDCEGHLDNAWQFDLVDDDTRVEASLLTTWVLDDTLICDTFEAEVLAAFEGSGRVDGCRVLYTFSASQVATCSVATGALVCDPI